MHWNLSVLGYKYVIFLFVLGNGDKEIENFLYSIATSPVKILEDSAWDKCGRPKNKFLTLTNGLSLCARYRDPDNKLIQGEI